MCQGGCNSPFPSQYSSLDELQEKAALQDSLLHETPIKVYYNGAINVAQQARQYAKENNLEMAYFFYYRVVDLILLQIGKLKGAHVESPQRTAALKEVETAVMFLEKSRGTMESTYAQRMKKSALEDEKKALDLANFEALLEADEDFNDLEDGDDEEENGSAGSDSDSDSDLEDGIDFTFAALSNLRIAPPSDPFAAPLPDAPLPIRSAVHPSTPSTPPAEHQGGLVAVEEVPSPAEKRKSVRFADDSGDTLAEERTYVPEVLTEAEIAEKRQARKKRKEIRKQARRERAEAAKRDAAFRAAALARERGEVPPAAENVPELQPPQMKEEPRSEPEPESEAINIEPRYYTPEEIQRLRARLRKRYEPFFTPQYRNCIGGHLAIEPPSHPPLPDGSVDGFRPLVIPQNLMYQFLEVAEGNTSRGIETCGLLVGKLEKSVLHITTLIIPEQKGEPDRVTSLREEDVFMHQLENDLLTLGWIHTHPTQLCFLSSVDLHTHFGYQIQMKEAVSIVVAPRSQPNFGVFSLIDPTGIDVIRNCSKRGFHPHRPGPIYQIANHTRIVRGDAELVDLRVTKPHG